MGIVERSDQHENSNDDRNTTRGVLLACLFFDAVDSTDITGTWGITEKLAEGLFQASLNGIDKKTEGRPNAGIIV